VVLAKAQTQGVGAGQQRPGERPHHPAGMCYFTRSSGGGSRPGWRSRWGSVESLKLVEEELGVRLPRVTRDLAGILGAPPPQASGRWVGVERGRRSEATGIGSAGIGTTGRIWQWVGRSVATEAMAEIHQRKHAICAFKSEDGLGLVPWCRKEVATRCQAPITPAVGSEVASVSNPRVQRISPRV
jgi:hypothetical protein